ncbi:MAG: hypothetical protein ACP6IY_19030 [Promethearchaeia archaeon]
MHKFKYFVNFKVEIKNSSFIRGQLYIRLEDPYNSDATIGLEIYIDNEINKITKIEYSSINHSSYEFGIEFLNAIKENNLLNIIEGLSEKEILRFIRNKLN